MPQSLASVNLHTIFSTKNREPWLRNANLRADLHSWMGGVVNTLGCIPIEIGGVSDHVHLLTTLSRTLTIADFVKETKRVSALWLKERSADFRAFHWQAGYGVFSIGQSQKDTVIRYVRDQEAHHRKRTFKEEFRDFLDRYEVEYDERYVWD
ncbi:MAG: IS200/IS605 family transposase [Verrucomicrobiae bacterium]|nr:IS200/IS605 family transposase [Verrucomicrobiae bacterium]MCP5538545.1 IS200/IS605 family transposase [Akkermansiaceae bacterium]MCP5551948.1 IS200/IS605 family transposase [Akkermansiaceae bacterium]